jgi:hypothetical protein
MRRYIVERIDGFPPMKDGASSMWGKPEQLPRLQRLRQSFITALGGQPSLARNIRLTLRLHVGPVNGRHVGDLDNFITGICDGLQSGKGTWAAWDTRELESVHPRNAVAIVDDSEVVKIDAEKIIGPGEPWYSVELTGE